MIAEHWDTRLQVAVVASVGLLAAMEWWNPSNVSSYGDGPGIESAERNEQSTPRSFVLPATPAVALEQERQLAQGSAFPFATKCVWELRERGFAIPMSGDIFDVKVTEAIFEFQRTNGITPTGKLDETTREALKCQS